MSLWALPPRDVRRLAAEERRDLVEFVGDLSAAEWLAPTAAPGWTVKDIALHLIDDDLTWLSHQRDGDASGLVDMSDYSTFVLALAAKNQRWVEAARSMSRQVVLDLLTWAGEKVAAYHAEQELMGEGWVSWASDGPVPYWFNLAQEFTERWVHQQQMREAVGRVEHHNARLPDVLRTFVWAFPYQYRAVADAGTRVSLALGNSAWTLTSDGTGRWSLIDGEAPDAAASLRLSADASWRMLTSIAVPAEAMTREGADILVEPLMRVRGIIV